MIAAFAAVFVGGFRDGEQGVGAGINALEIVPFIATAPLCWEGSSGSVAFVDHSDVGCLYRWVAFESATDQPRKPGPLIFFPLGIRSGVDADKAAAGLYIALKRVLLLTVEYVPGCI